MSDTRTARGHCLCGKVSVEVAEQSLHIGACHCTMCRRWGGGPWLAVDCGTAITFTGQEHINVYDSSMWAERGFCGRCGTHLFYRQKESEQHIMSAGLFDDNEGWELSHQIFIDEKAHWYDFANETKDLTGAEVFAKYAPPQ